MDDQNKKWLEFIKKNTQKIAEHLSIFFKKHHKKIIYGFDFVLIIIAILAITVAGNYIYNKTFQSGSSASNDSISDSSSSSGSGESSTNCSVLGLNLHGSIVTYIPDRYFDDTTNNTDIVASEKITHYIEEADKDDKVKAILLEVDSNGGLPVAGEEIAHALRNTKKPSIVVIRQSGLSAAYWAASGASYIFASRNSDVGSIGVTASYLDSVNKNKKDGYQYIQLSVGKYKDTGNPDKVLTDDEKALIMRDIKIVHQNFIDDVAKYRNISVSDVQKIADGSSILGEKAKELKLIDGIGDLSDAKNYIENIIKEKPEICWE